MKEGFEKAKQKFQRNPLIYAMILTGIIGVLCPFVGWLFQLWLPQNSVKSGINTDLQLLKEDLEKIRESYKKIQNIVDRVIADPPNQWKLSDNQRKLLGNFSQENQESRSLFLDFFRLLFFLIQGSFFFLLGIWIEKKWGIVSRFMPDQQTAAATPPAISEPVPQQENAGVDSDGDWQQPKTSQLESPLED